MHGYVVEEKRATVELYFLNLCSIIERLTLSGVNAEFLTLKNQQYVLRIKINLLDFRMQLFDHVRISARNIKVFRF